MINLVSDLIEAVLEDNSGSSQKFYYRPGKPKMSQADLVWGQAHLIIGLENWRKIDQKYQSSHRKLAVAKEL